MRAATPIGLYPTESDDSGLDELLCVPTFEVCMHHPAIYSPEHLRSSDMAYPQLLKPIETDLLISELFRFCSGLLALPSDVTQQKSQPPTWGI